MCSTKQAKQKALAQVKHAVALDFKPIDLARHANTCIQFAEETELCSFGSVVGFREADGQGAQRFIERIQVKLDNDSQSCLHVWHNGDIIGQLHLGQFLDEAIGYIHLFYVAPEWRGKGIAPQLDAYAMTHFQKRGFPLARLSVAPANTCAVRFYLSRGWMDLGPRTDKPDVHNVEKSCG